MISLIFFIAASVMVIIGMTGPTAREYSTASDSLISKESYYAAESAAEDAYYRYKNGATLGASDTVSMPVGSGTATISNDGIAEKEIVATGNVDNSQRVIDVKHDDGSADFDLKSWTETQ